MLLHEYLWSTLHIATAKYSLVQDADQRGHGKEGHRKVSDMDPKILPSFLSLDKVVSDEADDSGLPRSLTPTPEQILIPLGKKEDPEKYAGSDDDFCEKCMPEIERLESDLRESRLTQAALESELRWAIEGKLNAETALAQHLAGFQGASLRPHSGVRRPLVWDEQPFSEEFARKMTGSPRMTSISGGGSTASRLFASTADLLFPDASEGRYDDFQSLSQRKVVDLESRLGRLSAQFQNLAEIYNAMVNRHQQAQADLYQLHKENLDLQTANNDLVKACKLRDRRLQKLAERCGLSIGQPGAPPPIASSQLHQPPISSVLLNTPPNVSRPPGKVLEQPQPQPQPQLQQQPQQQQQQQLEFRQPLVPKLKGKASRESDGSLGEKRSGSGSAQLDKQPSISNAIEAQLSPSMDQLKVGTTILPVEKRSGSSSGVGVIGQRASTVKDTTQSGKAVEAKKEAKQTVEVKQEHGRQSGPLAGRLGPPTGNFSNTVLSEEISTIVDETTTAVVPISPVSALPKSISLRANSLATVSTRKRTISPEGSKGAPLSGSPLAIVQSRKRITSAEEESGGVVATRLQSPVSGDRFGRQLLPAQIEEVDVSFDGDDEFSDSQLDVFNQGTFKTELCNKWEETGRCPYGDRCQASMGSQFAHGVEELRPVLRHPRYKTELCRMVAMGEACPYGHRCHFRHKLSREEAATLM